MNKKCLEEQLFDELNILYRDGVEVKRIYLCPDDYIELMDDFKKRTDFNTRNYLIIHGPRGSIEILPDISLSRRSVKGLSLRLDG